MVPHLVTVTDLWTLRSLSAIAEFLVFTSRTEKCDLLSLRFNKTIILYVYVCVHACVCVRACVYSLVVRWDFQLQSWNSSIVAWLVIFQICSQYCLTAVDAVQCLHLSHVYRACLNLSHVYRACLNLSHVYRACCGVEVADFYLLTLMVLRNSLTLKS